LECYAAGFFKAGAVMVGGAAESLVLELAEVVRERLASLSKSVPKALSDQRTKTVADALRVFLDTQKSTLPKRLREGCEFYWPAFLQQIRSARNDAGHPISIDPVTPETVHASLLIFPEFAQLTHELMDWVKSHLT
jgi:hypothetical protein